MRNIYKILVRNPKGRGVNRMIILKWILKKGVRTSIGFLWLRTRSSGRLLRTQQ
jgi:hypothetical protein